MGVVDANVLVLNLDFQPLNVCNVRRAVVLLSKEKASVVEQNGHLITSERLSFPSPSVIRLAYHVKRPRPVVKMTRKEVLVRDDHTCQYCGRRGHDLTLDHVIPRHRGGQHIWENVVAAPSAVLASVIVAHEDFLARHLYDRARTLHVVRETDHRRRRE